jgi:hypothetical protein
MAFFDNSHGAKLENTNDLIIEPVSALPEYCGPSRLKLDHRSNEKEERTQQQ